MTENSWKSREDNRWYSR